eukprot:g16738.t1
MNIALDPLESLWPPYRGGILLGTARESQGRICNAGVAVTAGHVAISLDVHPDRRSTASAVAPTAAPKASSHSVDEAEGIRQHGEDEPVPEGTEGYAGGPASPTTLRLTVLLDVVPASAPKPKTQQLARFLTKVLGRSAAGAVPHADGRGGGGKARRGEGPLGADVPELLVVEHMDKVVCSEFVRFDYRRADSGTMTAEDASGGGTPRARDGSNRSSGGLAYACIEASGLLRLWEWRGNESGRWAWSYLESCNICACREEPVGCRVLTAALVPEPCGDGDGKGGSSSNRRHRLVWEQEDSGEGAGLGLASTPAAGPRPPRRVWSRLITLDLSEGGATVDGGFGFASQQQQEQQPTMEGGVGFGGGGGDANGCTGSARSEISMAFSACLLPTRVDALLCSRLGAWMPAGQRVYFNHFATARLPCVTLPSLLQPEERGGTGWIDEPDGAESAADGSFGADAYDGAAVGNGDGAPFPNESDLEVEGALGTGNEDPPHAAAAKQAAAFATEPTGSQGDSPSQGSTGRLFSVHDSTGDLMMYDHQPGATVRVLSLPPGAGGLRVRLQCTLDPPPSPPPASPPGSFVARSNVAVLCGGGVCSVYDLCTGRLIGSAAIPRCPACVFRRRTRSKKAAGVAAPCSCGRRQQQGAVASDPLDGDGAASAGPELWTSATRGHLLGILTATQVLRVRIPTAEACLTATLAPSLRGDTSPPPSAPSALRYLREYRRLITGTTAGARRSSPLPELLRTAHQGRAGAISADEGREPTRAGASMMDLIAHSLSAEERGFPAATAARGGMDTANGRGGRKDTPVPPWLLMAIVSASRNRGPGGAPEVGGMGVPQSCFAGGDPATAATEVGLSDALERRVEESLRSLNSVRALLQDPAGSARHGPANGAGGAMRAGGADDETASRLAALTAGVDPATALFEGTLREWLACRRKGKGEGELYGQMPLEGLGLGAGVRGSGLGRGEGGMRPVEDDALALAFRCEAAGDAEAMEIPFLHFLLEVSGEADSGQEEKHDGRKAPSLRSPPSPSPSSSSAYSTFLCLQLAGNDASPLFEIACRALFRLRPQKLPRFVERLARFRAFANEIKRGGCAGAVGAGATPPQDSGGDEDKREGKEEAGGEEEGGRRGASVASSADARSERTSGVDTAFSEEQQQQQQRRRRSPSPPPQSGIASRHTSEDNAYEHGGRDSRSTTRPSSTATSREHSPETPVAPPTPTPTPTPASASATDPPPSGAADDLPDPGTGPPSAARERTEESSRESALVAPAYFARALASLPPAVEDDRAAGAGSQQRRSRLSLLLGARKFAEACKLLRSRAWECAGSSPGVKRGSWRGDRGGEESWRAAMRLLNELRRAVAVAGKAGEDVASSTGGHDDAAATVGAAGIPLPLQFRLAFEDALAETILADSPERMEAVMLCRPEGLTPVAVVRMVRRASRAVVETSAAAETGDGGDGKDSGQGGQQLLSGSTQTLKMCLLLLLEDGTRQESAAV